MQKILSVSTEARRSNRSPKSLAKETSKPPLAVSWLTVEEAQILFMFRGQKTARFENGEPTAVTLEKS